MVCVCASFSVCVQECFLLDAANFKLKERFSLAEINHITVSSKTDGVVIIRLPVDTPNARVSVCVWVCVHIYVHSVDHVQ